LSKCPIFISWIKEDDQNILDKAAEYLDTHKLITTQEQDNLVKLLSLGE
jgi:hypothetical protein